MDSVIQVNDPVKVYKDGSEAVKGISFDIERGEFFGFLGPNRAGKSTTTKMITTMLPITRGPVHVPGYEVIATGLVHHPQILFLDEPTTGLDPQTRANPWTHLEKLNCNYYD